MLKFLANSIQTVSSKLATCRPKSFASLGFERILSRTAVSLKSRALQACMYCPKYRDSRGTLGYLKVFKRQNWETSIDCEP